MPRLGDRGDHRCRGALRCEQAAGDARNLGRSSGEFKKGLKEGHDETATEATAAPVTDVAPQPASAPPVEPSGEARPENPPLQSAPRLGGRAGRSSQHPPEDAVHESRRGLRGEVRGRLDGLVRSRRTEERPAVRAARTPPRAASCGPPPSSAPPSIPSECSSRSRSTSGSRSSTPSTSSSRTRRPCGPRRPTPRGRYRGR